MHPASTIQKVLVVPREWTAGLDGFVPWDQASSLFSKPAENARWLPRTQAEESSQWIQPIPCSIFQDNHGRYCVLHYPGRKERFSLIVGGHIDNGCQYQQLMSIFLDTLKRELQEEVGVVIDNQPTPIGLTVDSSSISASRHIGVVYKTEISETRLRPQAPEEFSIHSKRTGTFLTLRELANLRSRFDPWSSIIFSQYLSRNFEKDLGRQAEFPLFENNP